LSSSAPTQNVKITSAHPAAARRGSACAPTEKSATTIAMNV